MEEQNGDHGVTKSLKQAQKILKAEDADSKVVTLEDLMSGFDTKLVSLYKIAEQSPKMFQQVVKSLLTKKQSSIEAKIEILHRTCFLYFFQLLGIKEDELQTLETLFNFMKSAKKELTRTQMDLIKFDA